MQDAFSLQDMSSEANFDPLDNLVYGVSSLDMSSEANFDPLDNTMSPR